jgi:FtsH-binding integral membrane protein
MTTITISPLRPHLRYGLTLVAAASILLVAGLGAAIAVVASVWVFEANMFGPAAGLVAAAAAVLLFVGLIGVMHRRLWGSTAARLL